MNMTINSQILSAGALLARQFYKHWSFEFGKWYVWQNLLVPHVNRQKKGFVAESNLGPRFKVLLHDYIQQRLFYFGVWEPALTEYISQTLQRGDIFIDVGANIGYYSCIAAQIVGDSGCVHAVEASPSVYRLLQENIALNQNQNIVAHHRAAAACKGSLAVYKAGEANIGRTTTMLEIALKHKFALESEVQADSLDQIVGLRNLLNARIVKIDVEGAEWQVLQGIAKVLPECSARTEFILEISPASLTSQGVRAEHIVSIFTDLGYEALVIEDKNEPVHYMCARPPSQLLPLPKNIVSQVDVLFRKRAP